MPVGRFGSGLVAAGLLVAAATSGRAAEIGAEPAAAAPLVRVAQGCGPMGLRNKAGHCYRYHHPAVHRVCKLHGTKHGLVKRCVLSLAKPSPSI